MTEDLTTAAAAHATARTVSIDSARARELYKYFVPPRNNTLGSVQSGTPDTVLTAHAQLVAWRLNSQRAMISLIDREIQYFVAESTKTLHLDSSGHDEDHPDDAIWAGCVNVPKAGRLCEHTIATLPPPDGGPAYFEVLDLSEDERFNTLGFVTGPPHFRYYVGVPLRTKKGISIGSLFALDNKVRDPINETNREFLALMAENVMTHLEMLKEKEDRKRTMNMNMCLSAFVDPEHQFRKRKRAAGSRASSTFRYNPSTKSVVVEALEPARIKSPRKPKHTPGKQGSPGEVQSPGMDESSSHYESDSSMDGRIEEIDHLNTFKRAAELLRDALDLEEGGGGVVFLDTAGAVGKRRPRSKQPSDDSSGTDSQGETPDNSITHSSTGWAARQSSEEASPQSQRESSPEPAEILGFAANAAPCQSVTTARLHRNFSPLSPCELMKLIKRHPRGKLFTFASEGAFVSSSSDEPNGMHKHHGSKKKATPSKTEAKLLLHHFPEARQIIFLPLWDSTTSRWSACFAYNNSEYRTFANNPDYLYCVAFSNCVMTEIARLATLTADQQKSDFIGSISHELRSPLHGILASCEFLGDTDCTSFQKSLVDTADSCARTLLDTISMVLDYSKINSFERNVNKARRSRRDVLAPGAAGNAPTLQSHLNIYSDVDFAAITEEVVEGVATGHVFRDSLTSADMNDLADSDGKIYGPDFTSPKAASTKPNVDIILDIPSRDWVFWSQAGALRRVIMNLFGNSMKYTKQGYIKVKLEAQDVNKQSGPPDQKISSYVTLTVTDSGQGISPEYLRTKLFTPFAQESTLAPGTGLGLSLVRSIVNMLNGDISIKSTVNVGTEVCVRLPMFKGTPANSKSGSTPSSSGSTIERVKDESIKIVKDQAGERSVATFWKDHDTDTAQQIESTEMLRESMNSYLKGWFDLPVAQWDPALSVGPDVLITDELELQELISAAPHLLHPDSRTMVLVLCTTGTRPTNRKTMAKSGKFEELRHPFGPYKLARALRTCLEKLGAERFPSQATAGAIIDTILENSTQPAMDEVITAVEQVTLTGTDSDAAQINIVRQGPMAAKEDSVNAQMAIRNAFQISDTSSGSEVREDFPFPPDHDPHLDGTISPTSTSILLAPTRPPLLPQRARTISPTHAEFRAKDIIETSAMSSKGALTNAPAANSKPALRKPRMLLVDDNAINLKLLKTFMKKRKYSEVTNAEDGLQAVNAYKSLLHRDPPIPPDIILMDISMPVMNGFEATRKIREIERLYRQDLPPMQTPPSCLIIALTGLASGRDQSEAFTSGFDMYITKPVSFAEISRLLDNWEANGGAGVEGVPHGAVTAHAGAASVA